MCFMAQENQVSDYFDQEELLDAFNDLFCEFKKEKVKNKDLMKNNEKLCIENDLFKSNISSLNFRIINLENDISSYKNKYEEFLKNISKFKKDFNDQNILNKNFGSYKINQNVYSNFKNTNFYKSKYKSIWVPKDLNSYDKNVYITSYMNDVYYLNDYGYTNNWKSNSKRVWISND